METVKLNTKNWNIKLEDRSRGRMKLQIKLSKDESVAFKNFADATKPIDVDMDSFVKAMFLTGIETFNQRLAEKAKEYMLANQGKLEGKEGAPDKTNVSESSPPTNNVEVI